MRQIFFLLGVFVVLFLVIQETVAQPPEGFRRGRRSMGGPPGSGIPRGRLQTPESVIGVVDPARPPAADTTLGIGTVPALWEIKPSRLQDDDWPDLTERGTIVPPVPAKVVRYAIHLLSRYDTDGDGVLQREEWANLPGTPQAVDIDGDGIITLDELVRHFAVYGAKRTIHRPNPVETLYQPQAVSSQFQLFRPLSAPAASAAVPEDPTTAAEDMTEERVSADRGEEHHEDTTYEDIVAGVLPSTEKKYYTTPEALHGVPYWFLVRDRNGDGQVSLAEFAPNMTPASLALFGRLDKNGDGFITPDEVRKETPPKKEEPPKNMEVMSLPALATEPTPVSEPATPASTSPASADPAPVPE